MSVIIGLLGTIALSETMSYSMEKTAFGNSTTAFLMVLFSCILLRQVYNRLRLEDKRGRWFAAVYSFALSFALTAGKQLHTVENFAITDLALWMQILVLTVYFTGFVWFVFQWIADRTSGSSDKNKEQQENGGGSAPGKGCKNFLFTWLVIFICWIPVFLAFYPGAFVYDAQDEYVQVASRNFSTHHPLSHVLALGGFVCLGNKLLDSYNIGIAMYTIFQMIVLSGVFAYTVSWLRTHLSKKICMGVTLFYGLFPVIPMYAVCSAKDTLFNAAFLLMLVQMLKLLEQAFCIRTEETTVRTKDLVLFVLASVSMMLLRNNGVIAYGFLLFIVLTVAVIRWKKEKFFLKLSICMLMAFVLYTGVDKTLTFVLHADDSENQELLTVPIQQLARVYKYSPEIFLPEEKELLFSYIPEDILGIYDADLSDLVKANFDNKIYKENSSAFWDLWLHGLIQKPVTYLNAWFMTSYGYWYPDTVINVYGGQQRFTFQYGDSSYFGFETEQPGTRDSKFPWLEEQYRKMSLELYQQNVPGISMLFSPGFLFWIFMGSFLLCWYRKKYMQLLPMMGIFLLWFSVIPGPTFLVRYVLILWFAHPLILFVNKQ